VPNALDLPETAPRGLGVLITQCLEYVMLRFVKRW